MTSFCLLLATSFLLLVPVLAHSSKKEKENEDTTLKPHHPKHHSKSNDTSLNEVEEIADDGWNYENTTHVDARRILFSKRTEKGKRPYMVYLQLTKESAKAHKYRGWLCGGVIVDSYYVLTSAACVEDADRFYIVSGTTKFIDSFDYKNDECVCKHRRKVVWKCIPKNYKFDFQDSIKWSSNDIAIVKVDKAFKLGVQEKGCEFAAESIQYNNVSRDMEKPGTKGWIAGWGSGNNFREKFTSVPVPFFHSVVRNPKGEKHAWGIEKSVGIAVNGKTAQKAGSIATLDVPLVLACGVYRRQGQHVPKNSKCLQEAKVCIMDNEQCAKKWAQRFREIITQYMICTKDVMKRLSELCEKKYANCTDVASRRQTDVEIPTKTYNVDLGRHLKDPNDYTARRSSMQGGFCENDHGGPLIVRYQGKERVIGVISACKIDPKTHSCHGPFLYTSIYKNRQFISCAIHKDVEENCRRVFRSGITHEEWSVSWENVDDSGETKTEANNRDEKPETAVAAEGSDDKSSDESDTKEKKGALRHLDKGKSKKSDKEKKEKTSEDENESGSESEEDDKATTEKPKKVKAEKHKKSKSKKHKAKEEKAESNSQKAEDDNSSGDVKVKGKKDPVSYESSKDENVNEPDNE